MKRETSNNSIYLAKDETLAKEGDFCTSMFWLKQGRLAISHKINEETTEHIRFIRPGQLVGEISFIDQQPRTATIVAVEASLVIELEYSSFKKMIAEQEPWIKALIETLAGRVRTDTLMLKDKERCPHCYKLIASKP